MHGLRARKKEVKMPLGPEGCRDDSFDSPVVRVCVHVPGSVSTDKTSLGKAFEVIPN